MAGELLIPGGNGGPDTSGVGGDGFDFGLDGGDGPYNAFDAGAEFNFDAAEVVGENVDLRVESHENERAASVALGMGENGAEAEHREDMKEADGPPTPPPSDGQDLNAINAEEGQNNANGAKKASSTTKKGKKKAQQPVRDKFTTLHADDITRNREAYSGEMKKANLARDLQIFERGQKEKVLEMMTALPLGGEIALCSRAAMPT